MTESPLQLMKTGGDVTVGKISALMDLSLAQTCKSLKSLTEKGIVSGFRDGEPDEVISLTDAGIALADRMESESRKGLQLGEQ